MSKKDELLGTDDQEEESYDLNQVEKNQLGALLELYSQAVKAQDIIFTNLVQAAGHRVEAENAQLSINIEEVQEKGIDAAKLIVKRNN